MNITLKQPGAFFFDNLRGFLDASGQALAGFTLPVVNDPTLYGVEINFAYVLGPVPGVVDFTSNPISVFLAP